LGLSKFSVSTKFSLTALLTLTQLVADAPQFRGGSNKPIGLNIGLNIGLRRIDIWIKKGYNINESSALKKEDLQNLGPSFTKSDQDAPSLLEEGGHRGGGGDIS
jgi:hypothetical protein